MLQQTQIATVLGRGYYARWMERFPDASSLAAAREEEILKVWEGLGYYSRARNLQRAACTVAEQHGGRFPDSLTDIAALPGVGRYTAGAVLSFAFNKPAPIVDGNVARVLARLFHCLIPVNTPAGQRALWQWAETLLDAKHPREYNSALMELGQRICTPRRPQCEACPVRPHCASAGPGAESLPAKKPARATVFMEEHVLWCLSRDHLLMMQETGRRRRGLWHLPLRSADECTPLTLLHTARYSITHHRVTLHAYAAPHAVPRAGETWQPLPSVASLAMPGPLRRVVDHLLHSPRG